MSFVGVELLNRLGFVRSYIFRGVLGGDGGPRYRRDSPGDIWGTRLEKLEGYDYLDAGFYGLAVRAVGWLELPGFYGVDGFLVEAHAGALDDFDVAGFAAGQNYDAEKNVALILGFASFVGIIGTRAVHALRIANAAGACVENAAAGAAAFAGAETSALAAADSAARAGTHAAAGTLPIGTVVKFCERIAPVIGIDVGNFNLIGSDQCGNNRESRMHVARQSRRRELRSHTELGKFSVSDFEFVVFAATAAAVRLFCSSGKFGLVRRDVDRSDQDAGLVDGFYVCGDDAKNRNDEQGADGDVNAN